MLRDSDASQLALDEKNLELDDKRMANGKNRREENLEARRHERVEDCKESADERESREVLNHASLS